MAAFHKAFAKKLREARELRELTQVELARLADIDVSIIAHIETGSRTPSLENFKAICKGLHISADFMLGLSTRAAP